MKQGTNHWLQLIIMQMLPSKAHTAETLEKNCKEKKFLRDIFYGPMEWVSERERKVQGIQ